MGWRAAAALRAHSARDSFALEDGELLRRPPPLRTPTAWSRRPLPGQLLHEGHRLVPRLLPGDLGGLRAVLEGPLELDAELITRFAIDVPGEVAAHVVRAKDWLVFVQDGVWVEDLGPVLVPDNLEDTIARREQCLSGVGSRRVRVLNHLIQLPVPPGRGDEILALGNILGGGGQLLPRDHAPLACDLQGHAVLVAGLALLGGAGHDGVPLRRALGGTVRQLLQGLFRPGVVHEACAAIYHPAGRLTGPAGLDATLEIRVRSENLAALVHPGLAWVQHTRRVTVQPYLELLPPVLAERHGEAPTAVALHFHLFSELPLAP
mmetsp:Transcript_39850/g.110769  ORF Transcript_39850/g.110769 Transcript_39850/m.110769 type:complete len:320 (-) Transcript_39850:566-1525(-)